MKLYAWAALASIDERIVLSVGSCAAESIEAAQLAATNETRTQFPNQSIHVRVIEVPATLVALITQQQRPT